jgi:hypothetical protein
MRDFETGFNSFRQDQIQKHEKGMNRIGASRLQQIGKILELPAAYFRRRARRVGACGRQRRPDGEHISRISRHTDGQSIVVSFSKIPDVKLRRSVVDLVERLAAIGKSDPPRPRRARPKRK